MLSNFFLNGTFLISVNNNRAVTSRSIKIRYPDVQNLGDVLKSRLSMQVNARSVVLDPQ